MPILYGHIKSGLATGDKPIVTAKSDRFSSLTKMIVTLTIARK